MIDQPTSPRSASACVSAALPYHGRAMLALRPACASWMAGTAPWLFTNCAMRDAPALLHRSRLDEHDAGAALRELAQMHEVPVGDVAVLRRVLAHRRDDDAVAHFDLAKLDGPEELRFGDRH